MLSSLAGVLRGLPLPVRGQALKLATHMPRPAGLALAVLLSLLCPCHGDAAPAAAGPQGVEAAVGQEHTGDTLAAQGDLRAARQSYEGALAVWQKLVAASPTNSLLQHNLADGLEKLADTLAVQGDLVGARRSYDASLAIRQKLAAAAPANTQWRHELAASLEKEGDTQAAQRDLGGALKSYEAAVTAREQLAAAVPGNARWQYELAITRQKLTATRPVAQSERPQAQEAQLKTLWNQVELANQVPKTRDFRPAPVMNMATVATASASVPDRPPPQQTALSAPADFPRFPWPPPPPSASRPIPNHVLLERLQAIERQRGHTLSKNGHVHLSAVDAVLRRSLQHAGYEFRYYSVERGFALVARVERINANGAPYPSITRFDPSFRLLDDFSVLGYLRALFVAPPGYYRVIVFIVTPIAFTTTGKPVSSDEASSWLDGGGVSLPKSTGDLDYTSDYHCTALIYEFEKRDTEANPIERHPGRLTAETHLAKSGIAENLWNRDSP